MTLFFTNLILLLLLSIPNALAAPAEPTKTTPWWYDVFPPDNPSKILATEQAAEKTNKAILKPEDTDFETKTDRLRDFIASNAVNKIDDEYFTYGNNVPVMLSRLLDHAHGSGNSKPHMECSSRAATLYYLLKQTGIRSRMIVVKADSDSEISHTYLEVLNPTTSTWEIQDPLFNIFWQSNETHKRASTEDLLGHDVESNFTPCRTSDKCGYTKQTRSIIPYFAMAMVVDMDGGDSPVLINPDRYSMIRAVKTNALVQKYCLARPAICPQKITKIYE